MKNNHEILYHRYNPLGFFKSHTPFGKKAISRSWEMKKKVNASQCINFEINRIFPLKSRGVQKSTDVVNNKIM